MKLKLEDLTNERFLELFEEVRCCWHYCPTKCTHNQDFTLDELREEMLRRMHTSEQEESDNTAFNACFRKH
jgi:hypothetical protein